jgi:hypothetical protein
MDPLEVVPKRTWEEPRLVVHGNIEHITQVQDKRFGPSDGLVLVSIGPIRNAS